MTPQQRRAIQRTAKNFIDQAVRVLRTQYVLPCPEFHPFIRVGRDYYGGDIMALPAYPQLCKLLEEAFPERFGLPIGDLLRESSGTYVFNLLETCVAECSRREPKVSGRSPTGRACIDELIRALEDLEGEVIGARLVSHFTTTTGESITFADIQVDPIRDQDPLHRVVGLIPGAVAALNRERPSNYSPPQSLLVSHRSGRHSYGAREQITQSIDRFLLAARLLFGGTGESLWEMRGETNLIPRTPTDFSPYDASFSAMIRRTVRLDPANGDALAEVMRLVESESDARQLIVSPLGLALLGFSRSFGPIPWYDAIIGLMTALEATLSGQDQDITMRLQFRCVALLSTERDPEQALFEDLRVLYGLRSSLVHGAAMKEKDAMKWMNGLSTAVPGSMAGPTFARGVDRLRDIVRRAILCRLRLSECDFWKLGKSVSVDRELVNPATRATWRTAWRQKYEDLGVAFAIDAARSAADGLSADDF